MPDCLKIAYPTPRAAARALVHIQRAKQSRGLASPVAVHPCAMCHQWHITSKRVAGKQKRRWQILAGLG